MGRENKHSENFLHLKKKQKTYSSLYTTINKDMTYTTKVIDNQQKSNIHMRQ